MTDVILAVLGRRETAHDVLDAAQRLAVLGDRANIIVLAVDAPPPANALAAESLMAEVGDVAASRRRDRRRIAALKSTFDAWATGARQADVTVQWNEVEGAEPVIVEERGRRADFIVIARPTTDDDAATRQAFRAALFHTERPMLLAPRVKPAPLGRCVAIAWRDDSRTVKAVIPALRILGGAEQVHLLAGIRDGAAAPGIPAVLQDHAINASLHVLPIRQEALGKMLLAKAHALGADTLVMGAYAHHPLHEAIFGGVTRYMLDHADLPVLMRH
jgi:nucleotide-binding universal stress UspA family protein